MNFDAFCFHDATLHRVVEDSRLQTLTLQISMAKSPWSDEYEPKTVIFYNTLNYAVHEDDCCGDVTILDIKDIGIIGKRHRIQHDTTFGYRAWEAAAFEVVGWVT
jgi:hypothetical protein